MVHSVQRGNVKPIVMPSVNTMRISQTAATGVPAKTKHGGGPMAGPFGVGIGGSSSCVTTGRGISGRSVNANPLTVDSLNEFNKLQKQDAQQSSRQNAFVSRGGQGNVKSGQSGQRGKGRGEAASSKIRRPSSFSFRK